MRHRREVRALARRLVRVLEVLAELLAERDGRRPR